MRERGQQKAREKYDEGRRGGREKGKGGEGDKEESQNAVKPGEKRVRRNIGKERKKEKRERERDEGREAEEKE